MIFDGLSVFSRSFIVDWYVSCSIGTMQVILTTAHSLRRICGHRQVVRHQLPKLTLAGSSPVARSIRISGTVTFRYRAFFNKVPGLEPDRVRALNKRGCERLQRLFCRALVKQARHVVFLHESAGRRQGLCAESLRPGFASQEVFCRAHSGDDTILLCRERLDALGAGGCFGLE